MRRFLTSPILALLLTAIPFAVTVYYYTDLPETIPVHFTMEGVADRFGHKSSIWIHTSILSVVGLGVFFLISNLHKIDPKKTVKISAGTFKALAMIVLLFLTVINLAITLSMSNQSLGVSIEKIILPAIGALLGVLGYFMKNIEPNYFIGIRVPWTLEDPDNWKATHALTGKLWIPGGILIFITGIFLPFMAAFISTMCITAVMVIVPLVYSFRFYRKKQV